MIPMKTAAYIEMLINSEQSEEIVKYMMERFANESVRNARSLLEYSNHLLDMIIEQENSRKNKLAHALKMMMLLRELEGLSKGYDPGEKLAIMLPVCKTMFPGGKDDCSSVMYKNFFKEVCELLKNKEAFNWDSDGRWAESQGYSDYIKLIEKQTNE